MLSDENVFGRGYKHLYLKYDRPRRVQRNKIRNMKLKEWEGRRLMITAWHRNYDNKINKFFYFILASSAFICRANRSNCVFSTSNFSQRLRSFSSSLRTKKPFSIARIYSPNNFRIRMDDSRLRQYRSYDLRAFPLFPAASLR